MGDFGITAKDKWICPNDRQLALRAKLKAGWSVKSSQLQSFTKPQQLNDYEQESIRNVIKRAERIEKKEQERIGRLVDKLENMRKNAVGNGGNQCILCADDFGLLGASSLACNDCKMAVCSKCGVDTFSAHKEPLWLCKICAETREMWKKSGAWFFKGLPKYLLPSDKKPDVGNRGSRPSSYQRGIGRPSKGERNKEGRSFNTWAASGRGVMIPANISVNAFEKSDHETETSSDEDCFHLGKITISHPHKMDASVDSSDSAGTSPHAPSVAASIGHSDPLSTRGSVKKHESLAFPEPICADAKGQPADGDKFMTAETSTLSVRSGRSAGGSIGDDEDVDQIFSTYQTRKPQALGQWNGDDQSLHPRTDLQRMESSADASENSLSPDEATSYGTLEFSVLYDSINSGLHCTIHRAKGLRAMDSNGLSDPFVNLQLLPNATKPNKLRTKTVHKTLNPEFNETLTYYGITEEDMLRKTLRLSILDEDTFGHDFIGEVRVPLKQIRAHRTKHFNVYLDRQCSLLKDDALFSGDQIRGKILLALRYSTHKQGLVVGIIRCSHLPPMDSTGFSDPFAKIQLKPDPHKKKYKTAIKWKNLNPEFNEVREFVFDVKLTDLTKRTLEIAVWDKDYGRTNDYIGGLQVGMNSKGERLQHWLHVIKNPDNQYERWHHLGIDMLSD